MGKGHGMLLYLPDSLVLALAQTQVNGGLGRSFAGLLLVTEGAHSLGVLDEEDYLRLKDRYSTSLKDRPKAKPSIVKNAKATLAQIKKKTEIDEIEKQFGNALNQWSPMKETSKNYFVKKARSDLEKHPNLKNAKLILELAEQEVNRLES